MSVVHEAKVMVRLGWRADGRRWQAYCPFCGEIGVPQELEVDAQAIADRHREVGGFES